LRDFTDPLLHRSGFTGMMSLDRCLSGMQQASDIIRLSTEEFPERDRVAIFREHFGRNLFGLDIEPLPGVDFRSALTIRSLPGVVISWNTGGGVREWRTRDVLSDGRADIVLVINLQGPSLVEQRGREIVLDEQSATLATLGEIGGITRPGLDHHLLILNLPRVALCPLVPDIEDAIMRPISRDCEPLRLLIQYASILQDIGALSRALQRSIVNHLYDLVAASVGGTRDAIAVAKGRGIPAARLAAIKGDILENLLNRNFSVEEICVRHGITQRYVRMLFAGEQTTFSDFVVAQRLALVRQRLCDPACAGHSISTIAYECGFGDLSYFNRVFRRHFGMTPSDARAQADGPNGAPV
jgi:AraC-like DNA-binding protein